MAELKDIVGQPDLVCYQGSDPNTPATGAVEKNRGAIIYDRKTGLAAYHVVAPQAREPDAVDKAINWAAEMMGYTVTPPERSGALVQSRDSKDKGYDPLGIVKGGTPAAIALQYTTAPNSSTPKLAGCRVDFDDRELDSPDWSVNIPVTDQQPALKPRAPDVKKTAEAKFEPTLS